MTRYYIRKGSYAIPHQSSTHQTPSQRAVVHQLPLRFGSSHGLPEIRNRPLVDSRSRHPGAQTSGGPALPFKKNTSFLQETLEVFSQQAHQATEDPDHATKLLSHLLAHILCQQRHCITGLLSTMGEQDQDWKKHFELYASQLDSQRLFEPILQGAIELLDPEAPLVLAIDDSLLSKTGRKILESGYYRDPLGPPFHTNLIRALKFVQISIALPNKNNPKRARLIPVALRIIPKLAKLPKGASAQQALEHERLRQSNTVAWHAVELLKQLREFIDTQIPNGKKRRLLLCGDGHYTVESLLSELPHHTDYLGRTRGDMHIRQPAQPGESLGQPGRPPSYGEKLPTPEELRKDKSLAWEEFYIKTGHGQTRVRYKHIAQAKWPSLGEKQMVQVIVIAPFRFKKTKQGPWGYTQPAYLLCTDPAQPLQELIQTYLWRWDIEVNFKEQKQLLGMGQAQVRRTASVHSAPAVAVAAYAGLHLAYARINQGPLPALAYKPPKWYRRKPNTRPSTAILLEEIRRQAHAGIFAEPYFSDFSLN